MRVTPRWRMVWLSAAIVAVRTAHGLAAGDVHVALDAATGQAQITGTASDDDIAVTWNGVAGAYTIAGSSGTTIDGAPATSVTGVRSFLVEMGAGSDHVLFDHTPVPRDLRVHLGDGDDTLELVGVRVQGRTKLFGEPGADSITIRDLCDFRNSLVVRGGEGDDLVVVRDATFRHYVRLLCGPGSDRVTLVRDDLAGGGDLAVVGDTGRDWLGISDCTFRQPLSAGMGGGSDSVTIARTHFDDDVYVSGGASRDVLYFGSGVTWSRTHGLTVRQFP